MTKQFDAWSQKKKEIHEFSKTRFCHTREIWWCSLGVNVGIEQDGTGKNFDRPVLILHGFNQSSFLCVALTSRIKIGKYYFPIGDIEGKNAVAILSQIRLTDTKRLVRKICTLDQKTFAALKAALRELLFDEN